MPNLCDYTMRIKGTRENVSEFHKRMEDYELPNHLYRMFNTDIIDEVEEDEDGNYFIDVAGTCAWSIESCCRASGYSEGIDLLEVNTKELNLELECWSSETGMGFQEHYIYRNGECLTADCVNYCEVYYDEDEYESFEKFKEEYNISEDLTEEDAIDTYWFGSGGFDNYGEFNI